MEMAMASSSSWLDELAEYTKSAQEKGLDPAAWAMHLSSALASAGVPLPSPELSEALASHLCWNNYHVPLAWKYADKALSANLASPILLLALLSSRVIPSRCSKPVAYRLYVELLRRHAFSFACQIKSPSFKKIMVSVDDVLHLSKAFGIQACEPGVLVVEFVFCIVWQLLDATLDDEGLQELAPEKKPIWETRSQDMEIDGDDSFDEKRMEYSVRLQKINCVTAIELLAQFLQHKLISGLLFLARENIDPLLHLLLSMYYFKEGETIRINVKSKLTIGTGMLSAAGLSSGSSGANKPGLLLTPPPAGAWKVRSPFPPPPNDPAITRMTSGHAADLKAPKESTRRSVDPFSDLSQIERSLPSTTGTGSTKSTASGWAAF